MSIEVCTSVRGLCGKAVTLTEIDGYFVHIVKPIEHDNSSLAINLIFHWELHIFSYILSIQRERGVWQKHFVCCAWNALHTCIDARCFIPYKMNWLCFFCWYCYWTASILLNSRYLWVAQWKNVHLGTPLYWILTCIDISYRRSFYDDKLFVEQLLETL